MEEMLWQNYHKHTSISNVFIKDSTLLPIDYWNYLKELYGERECIYSTVEHYWQGNYFKIYDELEKYNKKNGTNIKFIFGVEAGFVKDRFSKDRAGHIILLARNDNGRKAINKALSIANKTGYYYNPRLDMELLKSLPKDDVMITSACISIWNKYSWEEVDTIMLELNELFPHFYFELQPHNTKEQIDLNKHILDLRKSNDNIKIICGVDSHVIYESQLKDRDDLLKSSNIFYEDEDGWYLDYPKYDVLFERFRNQKIMTDKEIEECIENTNVLLDFEKIELDRSLKVPVLNNMKDMTLEERNKAFRDILNREWKEQYFDINEDKKDQYIKETKNAIGEIIGCGMADYFLFNYEVMKLGQEKYGGILTPTGRGSAVSMYLNKLLRLTKVDKVNATVLMYPERFLTKERVLESHTPPDIDHNVSAREPFMQAQRELLGELGTYDLIALGTLHYKSAFKMYARAYDLDPQVANEVTKQITKYELAMKHADEDEQEYINIFQFVDEEKYGDLINGCQEYMGIIDNRKAHPCGAIAYDGDVESDIGIVLCKSETTKKEVLTALIESSTIDAFGYLKQDYLVVDSIGLTYDIYKEVGLEPFTINELLKEIEGDSNVWDVYKNGHTMCINQVEQQKTKEKAMRYKPQNISELTMFISGIRPSFQSMYKTFEKREHFEYSIVALDKLLQTEYCDSSFLIFQEQLMLILGFAGFPIGETYAMIKAISKKKDYIIKEAKPKFLKNFANAILETKETTDKNVASELSDRVWTIVENSASYGFCSAHGYSMALDSVTLAYLKAYYPLEFYKVCLQRFTNKGEKDKVSLLKQEMIEQKIELKPIKFREDNRQFGINKDYGYITQTMASLKSISKATPDTLYKMRKKEFKDATELFVYLTESTAINKTNIEILIQSDYFIEFGNINYLMTLYKFFLDRYKKTYVDKTKEKRIEEIREYTESIKHIETSLSDKIKYSIQLLGYTDLIDEKADGSLFAIQSIEINQWGSTFAKLYNIQCGFSKDVKVDKKYLNENPIEVGDVIKCATRMKEKKRKDENGKWIGTGEYEEILTVYAIQ